MATISGWIILYERVANEKLELGTKWNKNGMKRSNWVFIFTSVDGLWTGFLFDDGIPPQFLLPLSNSFAGGAFT